MTQKINGDRVSWGILGVGDVCEVKSAPAMQIIEDSEVVAVMRRNCEKAKDYAQRHNVPHWYDQAEELIGDPRVNAIYIATPPYAHCELTQLAAEAGKPVYVEKPMAMTSAECEQMINVCSKADVPLYVAYYRRMLPNFLKLKELIESGVIGEVRLVKIELYKTAEPDIVANQEADPASNWRVNPKISGGGYFEDLASHQLDFLDFAFGPIRSVSGFASNQAGLYPAADTVTGHFSFDNNIHGIGSWCFAVDAKAEKDELTIIGSKGSLTISFFGKPEIRIERSGANRHRKLSFQLPRHIQQPLIQTVVDDLLGRDICPSTGESAARTNRVMENMTNRFI